MLMTDFLLSVSLRILQKKNVMLHSTENQQLLNVFVLFADIEIRYLEKAQINSLKHKRIV